MQKLQHIGLGLGGKVLGVLGPIGVVGNHKTACAGGHDLVAVKAVAADIAHGAGGLASQRACGVAGAKRFGGVLNQNQLVAAGNVQQAGHIGHIAKHMHHAQRAHAGTGFVIVQPVLFQGAVVGTKILHGVRVNAKGIVAADEDRFRAHIAGQRVDSGNKGQGGHNHLIPAADARRHRGQVQRGGAAVGGNSARHAYISSQCFLKFANFGTAGGNPAGSNSLGSVSCFFFAEVRHGKRDKTRHLQDPPIKFIGGCARQKNGQRAHKVKTKYILLHYTLFYLLRQEKLVAARGRCYNKPYFAQSTRSVGKEEGI